MAIKNEIIQAYGRRWKIREARSYTDAAAAIDLAVATGSVGAKERRDNEVVADVVEINSDDTERKPYTPGVYQ